VVFYKRFILLLFLYFLFFFCNSQNRSNFGGKAGISLDLGTHFQRIGILYEIYCLNSFVQINHGTRLLYNRRNLGPKKPGIEIQFHLGGQYQWGNETFKKRYLLSEYSLMSDNPYSAGYMYMLYLDQMKTSQASGAIFFNIKDLGFIFENDFLGIWKGYEDKYRTGALAVSYISDSIQITLQTTLWTGKSIEGKKIKDNTFPSKHGYRDLSNATYGKISHGILALRADYYFKYKQTLRVESGVDAEQIRHALQNKLFHDLLLSSLNPKVDNPHYPMLQEDGSPYLYKENQKIKSVKTYFQFGINPGMLY